MNTVAERTTGWIEEQARGRTLSEIFKVVNEETRQPINDLAASCLMRAEDVAANSRALLVARDGTEIGVEHPAAPILNGGDLLGAVVVFRDVTAQRRLADEIHHRATHDVMTGLVNRIEFESHMEGVLRQSGNDGPPHALIYIDLDHFKLVNDACGHAAGDRLTCRYDVSRPWIA